MKTINIISLSKKGMQALRQDQAELKNLTWKEKLAKRALFNVDYQLDKKPAQLVITAKSRLVSYVNDIALIEGLKADFEKKGAVLGRDINIIVKEV